MISLCSKTCRRMLAHVTPAITIRLPTRKPWAHDSRVTPVGSVGLSTTNTIMLAHTVALRRKSADASQIRNLKVASRKIINCRGVPSSTLTQRLMRVCLRRAPVSRSRARRKSSDSRIMAVVQQAKSQRDAGQMANNGPEKTFASASYCGHPSRAGPALGFGVSW